MGTNKFLLVHRFLPPWFQPPLALAKQDVPGVKRFPLSIQTASGRRGKHEGERGIPLVFSLLNPQFSKEAEGSQSRSAIGGFGGLDSCPVVDIPRKDVLKKRIVTE
jgi:hypothetical protein